MAGEPTAGGGGALDLAVVGGGVAGAYVAWRVAAARPGWRIGLFERSGRVGGRLLSLRVDGIRRVRAELGGMRFRTSQPLVGGAVEAMGLEVRPFHTVLDANRYWLRGRSWEAGQPSAAASVYRLPPVLAGLTPAEVLVAAFERAVPDALQLTDEGWAEVRRSFAFRGRPLRDWSLGDVLAAVLDPEAHRYVVDGFGYHTVLADRNAADAIPWVLIEARPEAENSTLVEGMERLPRALAQAFEALGGTIAYRHELHHLDPDTTERNGSVRLAFHDQGEARARRVVLALPPKALAGIGGVLSARLRDLARTVTATPASKLFLAYDRPWWRADAFAGMRTVSDLPLSKTFYFDFERSSDEPDDGPALLLASYADGASRNAWVSLADPAIDEDDAAYEDQARWSAHPASAAQLEAAASQLAVIHPGTAIPVPSHAAFVDWADGAWHTWTPGTRSDEVMASALRPDPDLPVLLCGEAFSASQGWVEGALESAERVVDRLLA